MMTPDKDFAQLVSENIFMYKPGRSGGPAEVLGVEEVKEKFLVEHPIQVIDILALWGDASDNIPGAPGIGEKTSKILISRFASVEGVYENIDQLKGKQKENLETFVDQVMLSKALATIALDVPVELSIEEMLRRPLNPQALTELFNELEFKNVASRILAGQSDTPQETGSKAVATAPAAMPGTLFGPPAECRRSKALEKA